MHTLLQLRERLRTVLGQHLNDARKLSEFAMQEFQTICMFFRCFQIFFKKKKVYNILISQSHVEFFF